MWHGWHGMAGGTFSWFYSLVCITQQQLPSIQREKQTKLCLIVPGETGIHVAAYVERK